MRQGACSASSAFVCHLRVLTIGRFTVRQVGSFEARQSVRKAENVFSKTYLKETSGTREDGLIFTRISRITRPVCKAFLENYRLGSRRRPVDTSGVGICRQVSRGATWLSGRRA